MRLISNPWDRQRVYVQLPVTFANDRISCPNMAVLKISESISETAACTANLKQSLISTSLAREYMCSFASYLCAFFSLL